MSTETPRSSIWGEVFCDAFEEAGIDLTLTDEQIRILAVAAENHIDMEHEMASYGEPSSAEVSEINYRPEREAANSRIKELERQNEAYRQSVMQRRGATDAYVSRDGKVKYDLR